MNKKNPIIYINDNKYITICSSNVGKINIKIREKENIKKGTIIGDIEIIKKRYLLVIDQDISGKVISRIKNEKHYVEYGDPLFILSLNTETLKKKENKKITGENIISHIDGMFYRRPSPKDEDFIKEGSIIKKGDTLGLIEVMKCFYPLYYNGEKEKKVKKIINKNASTVKEGEILFILSEK